MKTIESKGLFLFFLILSAVVASCEKTQQEEILPLLGEKVYYRYRGEKIYWYELRYNYVVQMDTTLTNEAAVQILKANPDIHYSSYLDNSRNIYVVSSQTLSLQKIKQQDGVINAIHQYSSNKHPVIPILLHGTLALKLKPDCTISDVMSLIDNRAKIISKNKFGTIVIEVFNWDNLFHYCNTIAESGKVDFCEPVFSGGFTTF